MQVFTHSGTRNLVGKLQNTYQQLIQLLEQTNNTPILLIPTFP